MNKLLFCIGGAASPGKAEEGCGEGVGDAVTDMSSSGGESGPLAVVNRPTWLGELFGDVVLCALQLIDIGPSDEDVGSIRINAIHSVDILIYCIFIAYHSLILVMCLTVYLKQQTYDERNGGGDVGWTAQEDMDVFRLVKPNQDDGLVILNGVPNL